MISKLRLNSLQVRLPLVIVLLVIVAVGITAYFARQGTAGVFYQFSALSDQRDQHIIADILVNASESNQLNQKQLEDLGQNFGQPIFLVSPQGQVVAASNPSQVGFQIAVPPPEAQPQLIYESQPAFVVVNADANSQPANYVWTSAVPAGAPAFGVASVGPVGPGSFTQPLTPTDEAQFFLQSINQSFLISVAAALALTTVLSLVVSRRILKPIEALTTAAHRMEKGDLSQRVHVNSKSEIGELARAFNAMADGLGLAAELRRNLVSDVAHELRTPLANVRGYLEAVRDRVVEPNAATIDSLYEETLLLNRLIEDLQELAQAEAGQLRLTRQPIAPTDLVSAAVAAMQPQATEHGVTLRIDLAPNLPTLNLDSDRIGQAIRNLIANAIAHTPANGEVVVQAATTGDAVTLSVRDTGEGIAPEHLLFVFDRFYRVDPSRSRSTGGSGLGLAIVKQWVEAHGGTITVESEVGKGATFTITLSTK